MLRISSSSTSVKSITNKSPLLKQRLDAILNKYKLCADSDPVNLRNILPAHEVWRLFVDGLDQHQGWREYERTEEGYFAAMYNCFEAIYDFSSALNVDLIKRLHKISTTDVKNTNYEKEERRYELGATKHRIGEFRTAFPVDYHVGGCYFLTDQTHHWTATLDGIQEFLQKEDRPNSWHAISIRIADDCSSIFEDVLLSRPCIYSARLRIAAHPTISDFDLIESLKSYLYQDVADSLTTLSKKTIHDLGVALHLIGSSKNNDELAQVLFDMANRETTKTPNLAVLFVSVQMMNTPKQLSLDVAYYISEYFTAMTSAHDSMSKLKLIIELVHNLAQLHPFSDANCRTFCMSVLNYLLLRNGFPFVILDDPNRFDMLSREELLHEVLNGMEHTFELLEQQQLFGYKVSEKDLKNTYFRNLTTLELKRRKNIELNSEWDKQAVSIQSTPPTRVTATLFAKLKSQVTLKFRDASVKKRGQVSL